MLKFLTHKLRTHSLNEEIVAEKVEGRDSGTESDDEAERADTGDFCTDVIMKWNDVTDISFRGVRVDAGCACAPPPPSAPHAHAPPPRLAAREPDPDHLYDHHSSEEELEVINGAPGDVTPGAGAGTAAPESRRRGASSPPPVAPEKRKWSAQTYLETDSDLAARAPSSDDDDTKVETPVRFRTSPPLEALKPRRAGGAGAGAGALSCACAATAGGHSRAPASPRRRRAALPPPRRHRPALDFDKMQQLRMGAGAGGSNSGGSGAGSGSGSGSGVRSWRAVGGAHGGELSVFCW